MSRYDDLLSQLRASTATAYEYIPNMCEALKDEGLSKDDIKDKVTKDCLAAGLAKGTIVNNLPEEYKDPQKVEAGKKGAATKKDKIEILTDGSSAHPQGAGSSPVSQKEPKLGSSEDSGLLEKRLAKEKQKSEQLQQENDSLRKEKDQLAQVVKKDAFIPATNYEADPEVFKVPKDADLMDEHFYSDLSIMEATKKLRPFLNQTDMRIDIGWRVKK